MRIQKLDCVDEMRIALISFGHKNVEQFPSFLLTSPLRVDKITITDVENSFAAEIVEQKRAI